MKRYSTLTLITLSATTLLVGAVISWLIATQTSRNSKTDLEQVLALIAEHYVDSVDVDELQQSILPLIVSNLDPHSAYIPRKESDWENQRLNGSFCGIGITFNTIIDTPVIIDILPGGPSEHAGLKPGDRILKANRKPLTGKGISADSVRQILLGERASVVKLELLRDNKSFSTQIVRGDVPVPSVDVAFMPYKETGLIRIVQWGRTTPYEFRAAYARLKEKGMRSLIIDLRDNSGGYLEPAIQLANEFLKKGQLIVYTQGKAYPREDYHATGNGLMQDIPLVVLVNEFSASSSEVFAGAMQDHDRATIIGRRTFGKGLIQRPFYLRDSAQLRLTIARYYSPSGRCIQKQYTMGDMQSYQRDLINRYESGEMFATDSLLLKGAQQFKTDAGHIVYGGFGIMPTIFIPVDSTGVNSYYLRLIESGTMDEYAFLYVDQNRKNLSAYDDITKLGAFLSYQGGLIYDYARFAASKGIQMRSRMLYEARNLLRRALYGKIANYALGIEAAYQFFNETDQALLEGVRSFHKEETPSLKALSYYTSDKSNTSQETNEESEDPSQEEYEEEL
ncbi:S41 family peptidase [Porphyromonas circumdentaria]|uniref:C-terminal processing peptidase-3. Serine peptidase. MEROPS family S41A n=1 Tax=Porphyromonas circumdentaria TaxID=29524 RepID=A0A1T4NG12_9PORP|nr:S41 family peptidase [Porphyromonas circumdentaria]MBB6275676.1 carboxyl-terminal processing protease [Porphyromonas circumdentaria]MDO4721915.1 S41 family peptidase [Porphyromonas circumdentaria]SJZ78192.1 C-terminal processing peptidase-3. Serine peptidase. MEROPS family S41A [Porphyromonas circumdentaria]